jgi:hypothetical protein
MDVGVDTDVGPDRDGPSAGGDDLVGHVLHRAREQAGTGPGGTGRAHDRGALRGKSEREPLADAAGGPADDDDVPVRRVSDGMPLILPQVPT